MMEERGLLQVYRGYGLTAHLRALQINQSCNILLQDYNLSVVYSTITKLKKQGYNFKTKRKKSKRNPLDRIKVTRIENGTDA